jgi:hypothetical protein
MPLVKKGFQKVRLSQLGTLAESFGSANSLSVVVLAKLKNVLATASLQNMRAKTISERLNAIH